LNDTVAVADELQRKMDRSQRIASFEGVAFSNCVFVFVDFSVTRIAKCTFDRCVFIACSYEDQAMLSDWEKAHAGRRNLYTALSVHGIDDRWIASSGGRSTRERADPAGLRLTIDWAEELRRVKLPLLSSRDVYGGDWLGLVPDPWVAASRDAAPVIERLARKFTVDNILT
jgi:hypothetical protein